MEKELSRCRIVENFGEGSKKPRQKRRFIKSTNKPKFSRYRK